MDLTLTAEDQPELGVLRRTDESASYVSWSSLLPTILLEFVSSFLHHIPQIDKSSETAYFPEKSLS